MHLLGGQTWQRWTWEERRSAITPCRSMAPCCHHTSPRHRCQDSQSSDGRTWSLGGAIRNLLSNVGRARSGGGGVLLNPISKLKSGPDGSDGKHGTTQSRRLGSRLLRLYKETDLRLYRALWSGIPRLCREPREREWLYGGPAWSTLQPDTGCLGGEERQAD